MLKTLWNFLHVNRRERILKILFVTLRCFRHELPTIWHKNYFSVPRCQLLFCRNQLEPMKYNMIHLIRTLPRFTVYAIFIALVSVSVGCKSKKKAMEVSDNSAANKERAEREAALKRQQEEEERARREAEERAKREEAERKNAPSAKLEQYFAAISGASTVDAANNSINEALALFSSPETPVLIVIHEAAGQKDYDRPTNIRDYLNYLKDQKKKADKIGALKFDASGKINEVELIKQK